METLGSEPDLDIGETKYNSRLHNLGRIVVSNESRRTSVRRAAKTIPTFQPDYRCSNRITDGTRASVRIAADCSIDRREKINT